MTVDSQQLAAQRRADRRQRVSRIRRGAIGGSLATFAAAWVVIFSQLIMGHDPALAGNRQALAPVAAATASQSSGNDYPYSDGYSGRTLDPVTTQQS